MSAQKPDNYGMVVYDIPQGCQSLYQRIWTRIRKYAIRINLSVYLIPWGYRQACQSLIEEAMQATGKKATFSILKYDAESVAEIEGIAREQLNREIIDTMRRLNLKAEQCLESGKDIPERYFETVKDRLDTAKALSAIFGLTQDIQHALDAAVIIYDNMTAKNKAVIENTQA